MAWGIVADPDDSHVKREPGVEMPERWRLTV